MPDAASHTDLTAVAALESRLERAAAAREGKKPLIDVHISNIYRPETFRQHFSALLAAIMIPVVGQPGGLMAQDALAVLPNDAH
jgi:3-dehydroquinate dehydratase